MQNIFCLKEDYANHHYFFKSNTSEEQFKEDVLSVIDKAYKKFLEQEPIKFKNNRFVVETEAVETFYAYEVEEFVYTSLVSSLKQIGYTLLKFPNI